MVESEPLLHSISRWYVWRNGRSLRAQWIDCRLLASTVALIPNERYDDVLTAWALNPTNSVSEAVPTKVREIDTPSDCKLHDGPAVCVFGVSW